MNKTLLKEILIEQRDVFLNTQAGIEREKLVQIEKFSKLPHSVIISGIRRSGKSTLLTQIKNKLYASSDIYYLNFEDERLIRFDVQDFNVFYELCIELWGEKKVFFFDEIQNVLNWEMFVRRMQDKGFKFYITGSNALLLSKELGTKLTGRSLPVELFGFSFKEYLSYIDYKYSKNSFSISRDRAKLKNLFNEYLEKGGMPEYVKYRDPIVLKKVYDDILYRDVVARYEIKETKALRELALYFLSNIGGLFSYNKLKSTLNLGSVNTIKSYTGYLEEAFLIFTINSFSYSLKKQLINPKKVYCIDNGLANAVAFKFSKDRGKYLENLVFLELKRMGEEIYYYKTQNNLEVDFLIRIGSVIKSLIQVCAEFSDKTTRKREITAIIKAMEELNIQNGLILTEDEEGEIKISDKIIHIKPVYKWILEDKPQTFYS